MSMNSKELRTADVKEYLEIFNNEDHNACMKYITECFGDVTSDDHDKEGLSAFSDEVEETLSRIDAAENAVEDVAKVVENTDATNA